jgi:hypothetical protein
MGVGNTEDLLLLGEKAKGVHLEENVDTTDGVVLDDLENDFFVLLFLEPMVGEVN